MRHRFLASALALVSLLASQTSQAAITFVKPDLKVTSIGPSPLGANYLRVVVANVGYWWSDSCALVFTLSSSAALHYYPIPALAPITVYPGTSTKAIDVSLNGPLPSGIVFHAVADGFQTVAESNETNNDLWYVAP